MTRQEFTKMVKLIQVAYPRECFLPEKEQFDLWYEMFASCMPRYVMLATKQYIKSCKYVPTIADIMGIYKELVDEGEHRAATIKALYYQPKSVAPDGFYDKDSWDAYKKAIATEEWYDCWENAQLVTKEIFDNLNSAADGKREYPKNLTELIGEIAGW